MTTKEVLAMNRERLPLRESDANFLRKMNTYLKQDHYNGECIARYEAIANRIEASIGLLAYAKAVEKHEVNLITSGVLERIDSGEFPAFTPDLWKRWMELQAMRTNAISKAAGA